MCHTSISASLPCRALELTTERIFMRYCNNILYSNNKMHITFIIHTYHYKIHIST